MSRNYFDNEKKKIFASIDKDLNSFVKETGSKTTDISDRFERTYKDVEKRLLNINFFHPGTMQVAAADSGEFAVIYFNMEYT